MSIPAIVALVGLAIFLISGTLTALNFIMIFRNPIRMTNNGLVWHVVGGLLVSFGAIIGTAGGIWYLVDTYAGAAGG